MVEIAPLPIAFPGEIRMQLRRQLQSPTKIAEGISGQVMLMAIIVTTVYVSQSQGLWSDLLRADNESAQLAIANAPYAWLTACLIGCLASTILASLLGRSGTKSLPSPGKLDEEWHQLLGCFPEGVLILDSNSRVSFCNHAFAFILGLRASDLVGRPIDSLGWLSTSVKDRPWHRTRRMTGKRLNDAGASHSATLESVEPTRVGDEQLMSFRRDDGSHRLLTVSVSRFGHHGPAKQVEGDPLILLARDATGAELVRAEMESLLAHVRRSREEVQHQNEQLQQMVQEDALTGCRNRRALDKQVADAWQHACETGTPLSCLMFDIDHFKSVNDTHGHAVGDEVLRRVGQTLRETFAGVGKVYRYGGEEFCVLLARHSLDEATWIAERVRASIEALAIKVSDDNVSTSNQPMTVERWLRPTVSVGVSERMQNVGSPGGLMEQADKCLYIAKRRGRNQVVVFDQEVAEAKIRATDSR